MKEDAGEPRDLRDQKAKKGDRTETKGTNAAKRGSKGSQWRSGKRKDQGIEGSSVEGQSKGRTNQDRRLLRHHQKPIKGAKV